jgi:hypothetical protein
MTSAADGGAVIDEGGTMKRFAALALASAVPAIAAGFAVAAGAGGPTSVSLAVSPGGASCTYTETGSPKLKCSNLKGERIQSGTKITLVAKTNAALPAVWQLYIQKEPLASNNAHPPSKPSYPAPHLCGPTKAPSCTVTTTRSVSATSFNLFRAVVQKDDGTSFEADIHIRWCDKSTPGCVS